MGTHQAVINLLAYQVPVIPNPTLWITCYPRCLVKNSRVLENQALHLEVSCHRRARGQPFRMDQSIINMTRVGKSLLFRVVCNTANCHARWSLWDDQGNPHPILTLTENHRTFNDLQFEVP